MGWKFNPAPGWPPAPDGFVPPAGWVPDPSWPPAPEGWSFWLDDSAGTPATPQVAPPRDEPSRGTESLEADSRTDVLTHTPQPKPRRRSWRERREEKHLAKERQEALGVWQKEQDLLDALVSAAHGAAVGGSPSAASGVILKSGEDALWEGSANLVEPRRSPGRYQGGYSGVSIRIAKGVRYSVGGTRGHYVPGPEVQTPVDVGRTVVTTRRLLFLGNQTTREWDFAKLVSVDASGDDRVILVHVTNRERVSGLSLGELGAEFSSYLALGIAIAQEGAPAVEAELQAEADRHRSSRP